MTCLRLFVYKRLEADLAFLFAIKREGAPSWLSPEDEWTCTKILEVPYDGTYRMRQRSHFRVAVSYFRGSASIVGWASDTVHAPNQVTFERIGKFSTIGLSFLKHNIIVILLQYFQ